VFGAAPTLEKTLANLGIHGDGIGTTSTAQFGNPATAMAATMKAVLQMHVEKSYEQFVDIVAQGRNMSRYQLWKYRSRKSLGRCYRPQVGTGRQARYLSDAIAEAAKLANVPEENGLYIEAEPASILKRLRQMEGPTQTLARYVRPFVGSGLSTGPLVDQFDFVLTGGDPNSLYAHSLLPPPAAILP
jgi:protease IV